MKKLSKFNVKSGDGKNKMKTILLASGIGVVLITMVMINMDKVKTVEIVRVKNPVYINQLITKENLESYPMSKYEFDSSSSKYLEWENKKEAVDKYATVSTRKGGYIYKGDYSLDKPVKNEWLQNVEEGKLVVSLPYEKSSTFGNILTPGDRVKVNVSYTESSNDGFGGSRDISETLYEEAKVIDLLNNTGNSIYDYYSDLLALPIADRDRLLRDETFLQNVSPTRILYSINKNEGFSKYAEVEGKSGIKYIYGLYPRKKGDIILDQFSDLTRQITSALTTSVASDNAANSSGGASK